MVARGRQKGDLGRDSTALCRFLAEQKASNEGRG